MCRADPHPEIAELLEGHSLAVIKNFNPILGKYNSTSRRVRVIGILDQLSERNMGLANQAFPKLSEQSSIDCKG